MQCSYEGLLGLLFTKDLGDLRIDLHLYQLRDNKDLFYFCFDLLTKGIVYVYGTGATVTLDDISEEQFAYIADRMMLAGIKVSKITSANSSGKSATIVFKEPKLSTDPLSEFSADIVMMQAIHTIAFEIVRV